MFNDLQSCQLTPEGAFTLWTLNLELYFLQWGGCRAPGDPWTLALRCSSLPPVFTPRIPEGTPAGIAAIPGLLW